MSDLVPLLQGFFTEKLVLQLQESQHTIAGYRDTFTLLLGFAERRTGRRPTRLSIADLDAPTIGAFLQHLETVCGNTAATRHVRLAAMRSFFRYEAYGRPATRRDPAGARTPRPGHRQPPHHHRDRGPRRATGPQHLNRTPRPRPAPIICCKAC